MVEPLLLIGKKIVSWLGKGLGWYVRGFVTGFVVFVVSFSVFSLAGRFVGGGSFEESDALFITLKWGVLIFSFVVGVWFAKKK
jgi:hypothetical protein